MRFAFQGYQQGGVFFDRLKFRTMAIPKTGSRTIVVAGVQYRWLIRNKATRGQSDYGVGFLHVAVELFDALGTTAVFWTDRPHPKDWATAKVLAVTPQDVSNWIVKALALNWQPGVKGSQLFFKIIGEHMEATTKPSRKHTNELPNMGETQHG